jgi:hypothetical protein
MESKANLEESKHLKATLQDEMFFSSCRVIAWDSGTCSGLKLFAKPICDF